MKPVIRNFKGHSNPILGPEDGSATSVLLLVQHKPGESSPDHVHAWEHMAFITEGSGVLTVEGEKFPIKAGDAVLVPGGARHQFTNTGDVLLSRVTVNPLESVEG